MTNATVHTDLNAARKIWLAAKAAWQAESCPSTRLAYFAALDNYKAWDRVARGVAA